MTDYREGQTATNHKTGERVIFKAGQWVNYSPAPATALTGAPPRKISPQDQAAINKSRVQSDAAREGLAQLDEFDNLNRTIRPNGGFIDRWGNTVKGWLGNPDVVRMNEIQTKLARNSRVAGEGATSDKDAAAFQSMTGGVDKPFAANVAYSGAGRRAFKSRMDNQAFREKFLMQNGTLNGADAAQARLPKAPPKRTTGGYSFDD